MAQHTFKINKFLLEDMLISSLYALRVIPEDTTVVDYDMSNVDKDNMISITYTTEDENTSKDYNQFNMFEVQ